MSNDGSESVDQFLARIASVKEGRDETVQASRRMDEEFLKSRQERQARRLERSRSISPSKTGPADTLSLKFDSPSIAASTALNPPVDFSPQSKSLSRSNAVSGRTSPTKEQDLPSPDSSLPPSSSTSRPQSTATGLARSGTLSWQQRPTSRDGVGPRQRPLSGFASMRNPPRSPVEDEKQEIKQEEPSRKDIAASLAQKDPAWFRQTQDRGTSSAAYRKNQVEDTPEALTGRSMQLPGLSRSREPSKSPAPAEKEQVANSEADRLKRGTTPDIAALRNSMKQKPPSLRPRSQDSISFRPADVSNDASDEPNDFARSSSVRPASPIKGLGGFVESAMMRRSDSVSKRWSVRANTGLQRGDSVAGGRAAGALHTPGLSRDVQPARGDTPSSPLASSRPGSSHATDPVVSPTMKRDRSSGEVQDTASVLRNSKDSATTIDTTEQVTGRPTPLSEDSLLARSPSKTIDPRRWSPTKSTWLESALQAQPEPQKMSPMKEEQPKWKVDLQRSRSKASRDLSPEKLQRVEEPVLSTIKQTQSLPGNTTPKNTSETAAPGIAGWNATSALTQTINGNDANPTGSKAAVETSKPANVEENTRAIKKPEDSSKEVEKADDMGKPPMETKKPLIVKPKPQTPPKTDFRATLKPRTAESAQNNAAEPEFKAVFGKLKRAATQNYVAPDELKHNILSGKAALNTTGGPVKAPRVDAFKESILAKKEAMKASGSKPGSGVEMKQKPSDPVPEALARRKTLSKASQPDLSHLKGSAKLTPEARLVVAPQPKSPIQEAAPPQAQSPPAKKPELVAVRTSPKPAARTSTSQRIGHTALNLAKEVADEPKPTAAPSVGASKATPIPLAQSKPALTHVVSSNSTTLAHSITRPIVSKPENTAPAAADFPEGSKLATRLNPNLAAMLSRGSTPRPQANPGTSTEDLTTSTKNVSSYMGMKEGPSGSLSHMTKARAKGPKRRAPKAEAPSSKPGMDNNTITSAAAPATTTPVSNEIVSKSQEPTPAISSMSAIQTPIKNRWTDNKVLVNKLSPPTTSPKPTLTSSSSNITAQLRTSPPHENKSVPAIQINKTTRLVDKSNEESKVKPMVAPKSPDLRRVSSPTIKVETSRASPVSSTANPSGAASSKALTDVTPASTAVDKPTGDSTIRQAVNTNTVKTTTSQADESPKPTPASTKPVNIHGLGLKMSPSPQAIKTTTKPQVLTPPPEAASQHNLGQQPIEVRTILENYVGAIPKDYERAEFDAQRFLKEQMKEEEKTATLQYTVNEVTGDGKKTTMPQQQEHILYEESMYLIAHKFTTEANATISEVYLWCGDRVSDAAIEDAQIFCRRDAREHNAKLEVVKQGKEHARLIQALGGILIIRRNKVSAQYMLCGRKHLGHIVFDEVELSHDRLCPGFTYLISAPQDKVYLWKGKGAGIDETSSAKLISMDLGLTESIEEVAQGCEPASFSAIFHTKRQAKWADDWTQRAGTKGYPTAVYRVSHERPGMLTNLWGLKRATSPFKGQQVKATCERIQPFNQSDLEASAIHILDAYRTIYVLVTRQCATKASEFLTALHLAQEIAMFSPAIQDRPLLPTCYVVAGEMTDDIKACFRKWSAVEGASLAGSESICVRLEDVMEALEL